MKIKDVNFKIIEENNNIYIIAKPNKGIYSIKIKFKEKSRKKQANEFLKLFKEHVSDVDVNTFNRNKLYRLFSRYIAY